MDTHLQQIKDKEVYQEKMVPALKVNAILFTRYLKLTTCCFNEILCLTGS